MLVRSSLFAGSMLNEAERETLLNAFLSVCRWINIYYAWRPNLRDEGDNHLVELAVAGGVEYIVTRNVKDFRGVELVFPGIRVITPEVFLQEVQ